LPEKRGKPAGPNGPAFFDKDGLIFARIELVPALLLLCPTRENIVEKPVTLGSGLLACAAFPPGAIVAKLQARTPALPAREAIGAVLVSEILRQRCVIITRHDRGGPADKAFKYFHGGAPVRQRADIVGHTAANEFDADQIQKTVESPDIGAWISQLSSSNQVIGKNPALSYEI
jgi:hypothetical protein